MAFRSDTQTHSITVGDAQITGLERNQRQPDGARPGYHADRHHHRGKRRDLHWDLGAGTGSGAVVSHTYPAVGVYTAVVTASNTAGVVTASTNITVTGVPSLTLVKSGPQTAIAGDPVTYTLVVSNAANGGEANNLVITDTLPAGAHYVDGGTPVGGVISWTLNWLAPDASAQFYFVVTATETITNDDYRVSAAGGITATGQVAVVTTITQSVVADFSASPLTGTVPLTVAFATARPALLASCQIPRHILAPSRR